MRRCSPAAPAAGERLPALHARTWCCTARTGGCAATTAATRQRVPRACPTCGNVDLQPVGRGTQRIEETLAAALPEARIVRIDRDSARRKGALARHAATACARGEVDILVGTQMLAKGHDFRSLTLVGVLNADSALFSADFRAARAPVRAC